MNFKLFTILLFALSCNLFFSQDGDITFIEYDTINNGFLEMKLDKKMDDLLEQKKQRCDLIAQQKELVARSSTDNEKPSFEDLCRENPWMRGYRIQVLYTRSSEEAEAAKEKVQMQFPELSSKVVLRRPQFKVLLGDYFYKPNAAKDLTAVKKIYPGAILVASRIYCSRAQ